MIDQRNRSGAVLGVILVGMGVLALFGQFINFDIGHFLWPFLVIAFGGLFFVGMVAGGRSSGGLAIPGSIIMMIGLILLFQNTFGYWETWSYAWTLILTAVGIGIVIHGYWSGMEDLKRKGWRLVRLGLLFFLIFGAFFELVLGFARGNLAAQILWPLALIGVGLYLFVSRLLFGNHSASESLPPQDDNITTQGM